MQKSIRRVTHAPRVPQPCSLDSSDTFERFKRLNMKSFNIESFDIGGEIDESLRVSWGRETDALEAALRAAGQCWQPLVIWRGGGGAEARLVHGFRRADAARRLGWATLPAVALPAELSEHEAYLAGLEMFLATDAPNPVEAALIIRRLEAWFCRAEIIERFLPRLGLQPSPVIYQQTRAVADLPLPALRGLASGALDAACAHWLEMFDAREREAAAVVVMGLRASRSVQRELLEMMHDVCRRDEIGVGELLTNFGFQISDFGFEKQEQNLPKLREDFRRWLRARRFPILMEQERRFETARAALRLPRGATLTPPANFEGALMELRLAFLSAAELTRQVEALWKLVSDEREKVEYLWGSEK